VDNLKQLVEEQVNAVMLDSKQFKSVLTGYTKAVKSVGLISASQGLCGPLIQRFAARPGALCDI